jgi:AraC-like DNA-binding protein
MQIYKADDIFECGEGILVKKETDRRDKEPHKHEFIEIIFIRSGEGIETVGGVSHTVKRGDMLFVNFGREHSFSNTGMEFIHILLRPEFISDRLISSENIFDIFSLPQFSSIDGELSPSEIVSFCGNELITVTNLIDAMLDEYEMKKKGWRTALFGYTDVLITMLVRKLKEGEPDTDLHTARIEKYVDEHLFEKITLSDIAANCFYNPSYFSRRFKHYFGKNLSEYVNEKRLFAAARLLREGNETAAAIAQKCGFSDTSQFYRLFKSEFGCTPSEYRKR